MARTARNTWDLVLAVAAIVPAAGVALAQDAPTTRPVQQLSAVHPQIAPESVDRNLIDAAARPPGILKYGPVSIVDPMIERLNEAMEPVGLKVGLAYTALFQAATGGSGDRQAAGGDIDFFGDWRLLGEKGGETTGHLYFAAENRHDLGTGISPSALGGEVGSLWSTTNGFSEHVLTMKELYWQQQFGKDRLILRAGKLDPENYYNSNYWQSDARYFVNSSFSSFPVRAFPGQGLGVNATAKLSKLWYVSAGAQDAQGKKTTTGFDTLFEDFDLFGAVEVGFTPEIEGWGRGTYRLTPWYRDSGDSNGRPHDSGVVISFDQRIGPHFIPFFRAGTGEGNINGIEHMVSGGVGWEGDLLTESDVVGLGAAWGRPADHDLDDQYAVELFYRLQVSPDNQFTIGYQVIINPTFEPDDEVVGVLELRWRITM